MFVTNCYQAVVLMLFNKHQELTFTQVREMTNIPDNEIKQSLVYLCNPTKKILDKEDAKKPDFAPGEKLKVFLGFKNPNVRISFIPQQTHKYNTKPDKDQVPDDDKDIRTER